MAWSPLRAAPLLLALAALALTGCPAKECETSENCEAGRVCSASGTCIPVQCTSSMDCPIESWCSIDTGRCEPGCLNDKDCKPTHVCDAEQQQCIVPGCRTTQLDCEFGEFCNSLSGSCYDAGGFYCAPCERSEDCGSPNNICLRLGGSNQTYCGVDCSAGQECPRGYFCSRVRTVGDATVGFQCVAPCWELDP